MLFEHVLKRGEKDWGEAVPGKTSQQVSHSRMSCWPGRWADGVELGAVEVGQSQRRPETRLTLIRKTLLPHIKRSSGLF